MRFAKFVLATRVARFAFVLSWWSCAFATGDRCSSNPIGNDTRKLSITCDLRAFLPETIALSSIPTETAAKLNLLCNSDDAYESFLPPRTFRAFDRLEEISISRCKLLTLPADTFDGMRQLKSLNINTKNTDWSKSKYLELLPGSFDGLRELQFLNLSDSNVKNIPEDAFCTLVVLQSLNLSRNDLKNLESLGLVSRRSGSNNNSAAPLGADRVIECSGGTDLKSLDLSHNRFKTFRQYPGLNKLRRLNYLYIQHNEISSIDADSLNYFPALRLLNASYNHLEVLPDGLFPLSKEMREIYLQNNLISQIPGKMFRKVEGLLVLNLANNRLQNLDEETFAGLRKLMTLDLSRNMITKIESRYFKDLGFLQVLDLHNNSISFVEDNAFAPLYNLHTLNLADNNIRRIGSATLNGLYVLSKLTFNNNLLEGISQDAFNNCSDLKELDLAANKFTEIPVALTQLALLRTLDLGENLIGVIKNGSFKNMNLLTGLRLVDNNIGNLTEAMFWDLPNLQVLNLSKNKIQQIAELAFARNTELQAIRLDANFIIDIDGIFAKLKNLLWLNLSNNHLVWFDYAMVPSSLKWLDIRGNYIGDLRNYFNLQDNLNIRTLDASHNRITEITDMSIPNSVELVFVNNNLISSVQPGTFLEKSNLARVDMYANEINKLELSALAVGRSPSNRSVPEFYIGGNPFECDCSMYWLPIVNNMSSTRMYPKIMDLENVICRMPYARGVQTAQAIATTPNMYLCKYQTHCFSNCTCCEFDACDCELTCPSECTCYHDHMWKTNVVDCSGKSRNNIPARISMSATHVYLDGNDLADLQDHIFIGRKNMNVLHLNASKIISLQNHSFNGLNSLQVLHLEDNSLEELYGNEFEQLLQLRELYLQNNKISRLGNNTFLTLRYLQVLRLDGNRLVKFPVWQLKFNNFLSEIYLGNNRWSCACQYLQEFQSWVTEYKFNLKDSSSIACYTDETSDNSEGKLIEFDNMVCEDYASTSWALRSIIVSDYFPLVVMLCSFLVIFMVATIILFVFREQMREWLFTRYGIRLFHFKAAGGKHFDEDREKLYDAYVVYSPKDEEFVLQSIVAELEHGAPSYHLCLHYRDLPHHLVSGPPHYMTHAITPLIIEAAAASKRVILVLSRNFLQTEWTRYEFRSAFHEALRGRSFKLILVEDGAIVPEAELDSELRPYLKTNSKVRWGERRFWERLRYLMPKDGRRKNNYNSKRTVNNYTLDSMSSLSRYPQQHVVTRAYLPPSPASIHHNHMVSHTVFRGRDPLSGEVPPSYTVSRSTPSIQGQRNSSSAGSNASSAPSGGSHEEANYSSATTATPSPRPNRRSPSEVRPNSDHIYHSIDTPEYSAPCDATESSEPAENFANFQKASHLLQGATGTPTVSRPKPDKLAPYEKSSPRMMENFERTLSRRREHSRRSNGDRTFERSSSSSRSRQKHPPPPSAQAQTQTQHRAQSWRTNAPASAVMDAGGVQAYLV